jgi:hypothetical protein
MREYLLVFDHAQCDRSSEWIWATDDDDAASRARLGLVTAVGAERVVVSRGAVVVAVVTSREHEALAA